MFFRPDGSFQHTCTRTCACTHTPSLPFLTSFAGQTVHRPAHCAPVPSPQQGSTEEASLPALTCAACRSPRQGLASWFMAARLEGSPRCQLWDFGGWSVRGPWAGRRPASITALSSMSALRPQSPRGWGLKEEGVPKSRGLRRWRSGRAWQCVRSRARSGARKSLGPERQPCPQSPPGKLALIQTCYYLGQIKLFLPQVSQIALSCYA